MWVEAGRGPVCGHPVPGARAAEEPRLQLPARALQPVLAESTSKTNDITYVGSKERAQVNLFTTQK